MRKLVIFDLDGTLINSIADLGGATNYALEKLGFPQHEEKAYLDFVGRGIMKLFEQALPAQARTPQYLARMKELFVPYYDKHGMDRALPYEGIADVLKTLSARGILLAVVSNKYHAATVKIVQHYFPTVPFVGIYGQREGFPMKPDPALVHDIIQQAQVTPEQTLYVGDSDVDMQTARNAAVDACAVLWGFRPREELASYQPRYMAETPADLLRILLSE